MVCHARSASKSTRRCQHFLTAPPLPPLAVLNLDKPGEREAHDFLVRATSKRDRMWWLLDLRRQDPALLCLVRWAHPQDAARPFSLVEVSLMERAVCWRDYATTDAARKELLRRCVETPQQVA